MPDYSNPWTNGHPPGSLPARDIDAAIQRVRLDIAERMEDVVVDWNADPVIPLAAGTISTAKNVQYNTGAPVGSRASIYRDTRAILSMNFAGVTPGSGQLTIDLDEVNAAAGGTAAWTVNSYVGVIYSLTAISGGTSGVNNLMVHAQLVAIDGVSNTLTFEFRYARDHALVQADTVFGLMNFHFFEDPVV